MYIVKRDEKILCYRKNFPEIHERKGQEKKSVILRRNHIGKKENYLKHRISMDEIHQELKRATNKFLIRKLLTEC
jgi:hypothetical protein